jgi:hypothetical protein
MRTALIVATILGSWLAISVSPVDARNFDGSVMRKNAKGQEVRMQLPSNRAECLANRRALGFNLKTQGAGRCDQLFPR